LIGTSSNPVSGMTIATLMATCAMFLVAGWTGGAYAAPWRSPLAAWSQSRGQCWRDLAGPEDGYLVGATPVRQQIGLISECLRRHSPSAHAAPDEQGLEDIRLS